MSSSTKDSTAIKKLFRCSAPNCKNNSCKSKRDVEGNKITYHMFPHGKPALCMKWVQVLKEAGKDPNWTPSAHSKLCCVHFDQKFLIQSTSQTVLARDAVPSIFRPKLPKSDCTLESEPTSQQVPDLSQELYILNLLSKTQELSTSLLLDPCVVQLDLNKKESLPKNSTVKEKSCKKEDSIADKNKNVNKANADISSNIPSVPDYSPMELAIEIPDENACHSPQSCILEPQNTLCFASKPLLSSAKMVSPQTEELSIDACEGEAGKTRSVTESEPRVEKSNQVVLTSEPVIVGSTEPFEDHKGKEDYNCQKENSKTTGSLLGHLSKLKKRKASPDNSQQGPGDASDKFKKYSKTGDVFSKLAMSDILEVLAQAEVAGALADSFNTLETLIDDDAASNGDETYQDEMALEEYFDESVANFFMLEKSEAALPRLEAMLDSFMYFYGVSEDDLVGYVLHDSPFSSDNSTSEPSVPPVQMETEPSDELFAGVDTPQEMDFIDMANVVMVEAPQGVIQYMDLTTILEQQDIDEFIHTLNF